MHAGLQFGFPTWNNVDRVFLWPASSQRRTQRLINYEYLALASAYSQLALVT